MAENNPLSGLPFPEALTGNFAETFQWIAKLWGAGSDPNSPASMTAGVPSMLMPTLDVNELDKRIRDLRTVEHWLDLNLGLLRTTIQALEVQRNAIAAFQAMGRTAAASAAGASAAAAPAASKRETGDAGASSGPSPQQAMAGFNPALWWTALNQQFSQVASAAAAQNAASSGAPNDAPPAPASAPVGSKTPKVPKTSGGAPP